MSRKPTATVRNPQIKKSRAESEDAQLVRLFRDSVRRQRPQLIAIRKRQKAERQKEVDRPRSNQYVRAIKTPDATDGHG